MYPLQGSWTVEDYLALDTGLLVEFTNGFVRVLPMPTILHQLIVQFLFRALDDFVAASRMGHVLLAPLPVKLIGEKYREPDIVFVRPERITTLKGFPTGADLVIEVVSEGHECRDRDYIEKRTDYAAAHIAEYWIVDPQLKAVTVLSLDGDAYREHGVFSGGASANSVLLPGFNVEVHQLFARPGNVS
jgi:Uma2 family endonuclease